MSTAVGFDGSVFSLFNSLSILIPIGIAVCYVMLFLADRNILDLAIAGLLFVSGVTSFIFPLVPGIHSVVYILLSTVGGAYNLAWALKEKDKNPLLFLLLLCAFAYSALGGTIISAIFGRFSAVAVSVISSIGTLVCHGIHAFAAFCDMQE